ncbi:MAG: peptidoglycan DD-metalloendopeptidase family protein [Clostridiaceae bacterium]|jgi:murein DD-endopeptidase MepM/ murein hydrolase activator NlpD|nr:peptidoglycan DD-metalloendopeptidase family protein [Clostridiaceae bacterium]
MIKRISAVLMSFVLIATLAFTSSANSIDEAKKELQQTQKEINSIKNKQKQEKQNLINNKQYRENIIADLEKKGHERSEIESRIKEIESAIASLDEAIRLAEEEYAAELKLFQERLVTLYINSKTNAEANLLLQCDNFEEMFKKSHILKMVSQFDQDLLKSIEDKQEEISILKDLKQQEEDNAQEQLESMLGEIAKLEVSRSAVEKEVKKTQQTLAELEKAEDELEADSKELEKLIRKLSSSGAYSGGIMQWPLPGYYRISSYFGMRMHPILKYNKMHGGIDIGAPSGTPIHAAASGKVICAAWRSGGSGNTVIIDHGGGITTLYFHIKNGGILVKEGQKVAAGDVIAKVGSTGLSTGPHLHFEVRKNGTRQNPLDYVTNKK